MADLRRRAPVLAAFVLAALAAGGAGWVAGRRSVPVPPDPVFANPFRDAAKDEVLVLGDGRGGRTSFHVIEAGPDDVLLEVLTQAADGATTRRHLRVLRTYLGAFHVLEGDMDPAERVAAVRDVIVDRAVPETLHVLGRDLPCWRVETRHRVHGPLRIWISDALPVHGVARIESHRHRLEVESAGWPQ